MTDRDHFAAAALTGLLSNIPRYYQLEPLTRQAWEIADAMLRERERTDHDAAPAAIANAESVAPQPTAGDRAGNPPSHSGTGDTPKPISGCVSDRPTPITGPDPDSRVWGTHTPATHATHGEGSVRREGTEPVAWGVADGKGLLATSIHRIDAVDMQSEYEVETAIVPLYRHPPALTDAEREVVEWAIEVSDSLADCGATGTGGEESRESAVLRGLLVRLGGER